MGNQIYASYALLGFAIMQTLGFMGTAYPAMRVGTAVTSGLAIVLSLCYGLMRYQEYVQMGADSRPVLPFIPSIILVVLIVSAIVAGVISGI